MADEIDYGQAEIQAFNNLAAAGGVRYDEAAAKKAVQLYQNAIDRLTAIQRKLGTVQNAGGFGGFQTGRELQQGFSRKASDGIFVVQQLIDGAMQLQEAYLRAGNLISEADSLNQKRIAMTSAPPAPGGM
ncbi:hypothetical protein C5E45_17790 [Nocardia nova]|uniref:Uncharacterized protein n=1 Tax=Nocardia nova TaxID=37330 RepID=A0A2S6APD1_9NOCA|nr:hypothetical protein [Nocardia nova]PPJ28820.1 hypothetical protein C5E41_12175 [Nocardia nova]PPJ37062.1 hypothetical protein C5E45_17790 [Nocardia nova]